MRLLQYSDIESVYDTPTQVGALTAAIRARRDDDAVVVGTGDDVAPSVLALVTRGRQSLDFFEAVEPDVETFGNHDFDFGLDAARDVVRSSPQQWTTANVYEGTDPFADMDPYVVVERDGESAGFVGVTEQESAITDDLTVTDPVAAARNGVAELRSSGVDWVVVLAHVNDDKTRRIARTSDPDVILGGHVHEVCCDRIADTLLVRPDAGGSRFWEVTLGERADATCHEVSNDADPEVVAALTSRQREAGLAEVVGTLDAPLEHDRDRCFDGECRTADFVADAYRWASEADVGLVDTRAIRSGPPLIGDVTVADLVGLVPFDGQLTVVSITGQELRDLLDEIVLTDCTQAGRAGRDTWWGHFSGMAVTWDRREQVVRDVTVGGQPVESDESYTLASNSYVVNSDDEFTVLGPEAVTRTAGPQYQAIVDYARENGFELLTDDRIRYYEASSGTDSPS